MECLIVGGFGGPATVALYPGEPVRIRNKIPVICTPQWHTLQQAKNEINTCYQEGKWDDYKKVTNPYEYIFLSWNRRSSRSVATRQPLSRSYFKLVELWHLVSLPTWISSLVKRDGGLVTAHAAEGPGGFIEACTVLAGRRGWEFQRSTAITLRSDAKKIPGWRKAHAFLASYPQIVIHDGADGTGDILKRENQDAYVSAVRKAHPGGVHVYTADGGFDFSGDYNGQEDAIFPLLVAEALLGLRVLAKGGVMIIKCFDTTEQQSLDLVWLLSRAFREWRVVKPLTSRTGNSERYIIGLGYLDDAADITDLLEKESFSLERPTCSSYKETVALLMTLQEHIEQAEVAVIRKTLDLIKTTELARLRLLVQQNVKRSIAWCKEHGEEVALCWETDLERNLDKEATDLLQILQSDPYGSSWSSGGRGLIRFSTFRSETRNTVFS
jgi:23S rRNA U2552 (ribose-2'-O)-methylase RlmE/FtsJ/exonuclease VII small subunit